MAASEEASSSGSSPPPAIGWLETSVAACSGALLTSLFTTPLDVARVRMQAPGAAAAALAPCECCPPAAASASAAPPALSTSSTMLRVARHEGVAALWAGLQPALIISVPGTVLYFAAYEAARDVVAERAPSRQLREQAPLLAGGGARLLTATIVSPVELMRTRMQAEQALLREGMLGGASALVRREGWGALWKGLQPTLWRDVPFSMLYWSGYEALKARLLLLPRAHGAEPPAALPPAQSFACGAVAGAVAAFLTTPFDVLKTRRQVVDSSAHRHPPPGPPAELGTLELIAWVARREGAAALLAGVGPRLAKVAPSCAIMIASYEMGKRFFQERARPE